MKKIKFWILDKLLIIGLAFIVIAFGLLTLDLFKSNSLDHLSFDLEHFDAEIFSIDHDYLVNSPEEGRYYVYPSQVSFSASGDFGRIWSYVVSIAPLIVLFIIIWFMWCFVRETRKGRFFSIENVNYLRRIAGLFLLLEFIEYLHEVVGSYYFNLIIFGEKKSFVSLNFLPDLTSYFTIALLIFIITEAFAHGLKLKEEQDLTI